MCTGVGRAGKGQTWSSLAGSPRLLSGTDTKETTAHTSLFSKLGEGGLWQTRRESYETLMYFIMSDNSPFEVFICMILVYYN